MTLRSYAYWDSHGRPYQNATPIAEISAALVRIHGEDVLGDVLGMKGNTAHMKAVPPEDHTPFSHTGWPIESEYGYGHAIDWRGPNYQRLGTFWIAERDGGRAPWWKYINLAGVHTSWMPDKHTGRSSDQHLHGSIRSDWTHRSLAYGTVTLRRGHEGTHVRNLQRSLNGNLTSRLDIRLAEDGVFGPKTESRVKYLQERRHITVDGIAGPKTHIELAVF